jgi:hypothetical protein
MCVFEVTGLLETVTVSRSAAGSRSFACIRDNLISENSDYGIDDWADRIMFMPNRYRK